jgi:peptidyl-dipeptidase Dcp
MRPIITLSLIICLSINGCSTAPAVIEPVSEDLSFDNPLLVPFDSPFGIPPFEQIETAHFLPAYYERISQHEAEIEAIINNPEAPTFENTIAALDYSWQPLDQVSYIFYNYYAVLYDEQLEEIAGVIEPILTEHSDDIILNRDLFARVEAVYATRDELTLDEEEAMLLDLVYRDFAENGAALAEEDRQTLRDINRELSLLTLQFGNNIYADLDHYELFIDDPVLLSGLPENVVASAASAAKEQDREGEWLFTLYSSNIMALMTYAENREQRQEANEAYINRGGIFPENSNTEIVNRIIELRLELANLLGHENYATYALQNNMAKNPETVNSFLTALWEAALPVAHAEEEMIKEAIAEEGLSFEPAYWDWRYYAEKIRREKFAVDEDELRQYLELNQVLEGLFAVIENLWGLQFNELSDLPLYHPATSVWQVTEADGSHLGVIYLDLHSRPGKEGGASMKYFRPQYIDQSGTFIHPILLISCNFSNPPEGAPALLSYEEVTTLYHEFGHALHALLSKVRFPLLSGTATPQDFLELPSQIMENWARHPEVLKSFARHYETGEVIPDALIAKIEAANHFNQGFKTLELLASAQLDQEYHSITAYQPFMIKEYEKELLARFGMPESIYFRHGSTHFQHIFNWSYSAAYYSYLWSGVLDADAFEAFVETGDLFDPDTAERFRKEILEKGGTRDPLAMYLAFRGREPVLEPLLRQRGLK